MYFFADKCAKLNIASQSNEIVVSPRPRNPKNSLGLVGCQNENDSYYPRIMLSVCRSPQKTKLKQATCTVFSPSVGLLTCWQTITTEDEDYCNYVRMRRFELAKKFPSRPFRRRKMPRKAKNTADDLNAENNNRDEKQKPNSNRK